MARLPAASQASVSATSWADWRSSSRRRRRHLTSSTTPWVHSISASPHPNTQEPYRLRVLGIRIVPSEEADADEVATMALRVWKLKEGEMVSLMVHLGDRLGLYRAMAGAGALGAADLAERTGTHPRWVLEWLRSQAAAGLVESSDGESFELGPAGAAVLADEDRSVWFAAGAFGGCAAPAGVVEGLAEAFRSGLGLPYDAAGADAARSLERMLGPWSRLALVPRILPALAGVVEALGAGGVAADVGCGAGVAALAVAGAFPRCTVEGWDPSAHAIELATRRRDGAGVTNVEFRCAPAEDLPEDRYELVMALDCLHDMAYPARALSAIRRSLRPGGALLVKEIRAGETWAANQRNPLLAMMYSTSVATCMSSGLSEPGGAGLGTLGLPSGRLGRMCADAGFSSFAARDFDDPANLYYEVRA